MCYQYLIMVGHGIIHSKIWADLCHACRPWTTIMVTPRLPRWWTPGQNKLVIQLSPSTLTMVKSPRATSCSTTPLNLGTCWMDTEQFSVWLMAPNFARLQVHTFIIGCRLENVYISSRFKKRIIFFSYCPAASACTSLAVMSTMGLMSYFVPSNIFMGKHTYK